METKDILKALRKQRGMTGQEVADGCGMTYKVYQAYESGARNLGVPALEKLADFYGVTTDYLLGREPAPDPFGNLCLEEESEKKVLEKYMSFPPEIRACLLDVLVKLGETAKHTEPQEKNSGSISVSTTLGELEDQMKAEAEAHAKDAG